MEHYTGGSLDDHGNGVCRSVAVLAFILLNAVVGLGQMLPPSFDYKRETGPGGVAIFILNPNIEAVIKDARDGKSFEILTATVQPERGNYALIFWNAKPEYQLYNSRDTSCDLWIDGTTTKYPRFQPSPNRREFNRIRIEGASVEMDKLTFERWVKARNVSIRCGPVRYTLNKNNIDALIYFGTEISNDLKRRGAAAK